MGGGGGGSTQTTKEMPEFLRDAQRDVTLGAVQSALERPHQDYQGLTTAPMNQAQQTAISMAEGRALSGSPLTDSAGSWALNAMNGGLNNPFGGATTAVGDNTYMSDPWIDQVAENMVTKAHRGYAAGTAANNDAMFAQAGAFGGSAHQAQTASNAGAFADSMQSQLAQLYSNDLFNKRQVRQDDIGMRAGIAQGDLQRNANTFGQDQQMQWNAAQFAPTLAENDYRDINHLLNAGNYQNDYTQRLLDADRQRFDQSQAWTSERHAEALNFLNAGAGNTGTLTANGANGQNQQLLAALAGGAVGYGMGL